MTTPLNTTDARAAMTAQTPQLFLKKGRRLIEVKPSQCHAVMEIYRGDRGASEMRRPWLDLYDIDAHIIGRISYNGRVWLGRSGEQAWEVVV